MFLGFSVLGIVIFENLGLLYGVLDRFVVGFDYIILLTIARVLLN